MADTGNTNLYRREPRNRSRELLQRPTSTNIQQHSSQAPGNLFDDATRVVRSQLKQVVMLSSTNTSQPVNENWNNHNGNNQQSHLNRHCFDNGSQQRNQGQRGYDENPRPYNQNHRSYGNNASAGSFDRDTTSNGFQHIETEGTGDGFGASKAGDRPYTISNTFVKIKTTASSKNNKFGTVNIGDK